MILSARDPSIMTAEERLAELAEALAVGYLRVLIKRQKELEDQPKHEALCSVVDGTETVAGKESQ